jgi:hypothetical protein
MSVDPETQPILFRDFVPDDFTFTSVKTTWGASLVDQSVDEFQGEQRTGENGILVANEF